MSLLEVRGLEVRLPSAAGELRALREVDLSLERGRTLGLVGESGCGKSMTALALMGLLPEGARVAGSIRFDGMELTALGEPQWCRLRGARIAMVFQEPMSSLNPLHRIGRQVAEALVLHGSARRGAAEREAERLLDQVGIEDAARRVRDYPHQLSGGQRQRVMIAMALANRPDLLIADEPTTALDVTVQRQILDLIAGLVADLGMAMLLISHDLGVIARSVEHIAVMYGGTVVETGPSARLLAELAHPYTRGLVAGLPRIGRSARLRAIPGTVPPLAQLPPGCTFAGRCPIARATCAGERPPVVTLAPGHQARCVALGPGGGQDPG